MELEPSICKYATATDGTSCVSEDLHAKSNSPSWLKRGVMTVPAKEKGFPPVKVSMKVGGQCHSVMRKFRLAD